MLTHRPPQISNIAATLLTLFLCIALFSSDALSRESERRISVDEYRQKMTAGWIGQMAGVGWGFPTEFKWLGKIIPEEEVPAWRPEMINAFDQDDLYVEMTFLRSMEQYGFDVSSRQAGIDFANSKYPLWVANREGKRNLRAGIAPPDSGHPQFNTGADAIDYQIEADFSGLIAPGMPNIAIELGERFGRLMNYGDGLYGGQFVGAMYAEAFFADDPRTIVTRALRAIPTGSQYAEAVRDVLNWHRDNPHDWQATWELINNKYHLHPDYRQFPYQGATEAFNIDAKLNGAYIVLGLLYGGGDPEKTITIAMRAGQDSDCNPSNAAGILLTALGYDSVPATFLTALDKEQTFSFTEYTFPGLVEVSEKLAREAVVRAGGRIETNTAGEEVFVIPASEPVPSALEQSHSAGAIAGSVFSAEEMSLIEGSTALRYALPCLVLLLLLASQHNRSASALAILIPLAIVYSFGILIRATTPADLLSTISVDALVEGLAVSFALMLLLQPWLATLRSWLASVLLAALVLSLAGITAALAAEEARVTATFELTLLVFAVLASLWLVGVVAAGAFARKRFSYRRFTLTFVIATFVAGVAGVYLVLYSAGGSKGPLATALQDVAMYGGAPVLTVLMLPFLVLAAHNATYDERVKHWLGVGSPL